jgi:predicted Zn-dependent peptidase
MASYAKYGKENPFTDILSKTDLEALTPAALIAKIKGITAFEHRIFYYGTQTPEAVANTLSKEHKTPKKLKPLYAAKMYDELATDKNKVLFVHFPMVQAEILMISKGTPQYSVDEHIMSQYYNNYFGAGLSSIVFQEIREARALAYSANAFFSTPSKQDRAHYYQAYVGTQADKLKDAVTAMQEIINEMPISEIQIEQAKQSVLKTIESERITKANIYWTYRSNLDRGIENDIRQNVYQVVQNATAEDLKNFQKQSVKGRNFTYLILGDRARVNFEYLNALGEVKELSLEEIYGY